MPRAPFQVLVFLFRQTEGGQFEFALFKRSDASYWQGVAGGGEDEETPLQAAQRETYEEAGISPSHHYFELNSLNTVPVAEVCGFLWGQEVLVIPEYCFGVEINDEHIILSAEHSDIRWTDYETARRLLKWDSNKNAIWELNFRLTKGS